MTATPGQAFWAAYRDACPWIAEWDALRPELRTGAEAGAQAAIGAQEPQPAPEALSSPAELARWVEVNHGDHREWVGELRALLPGEPQPAPEAPGLRGALIDAMLRWSGRDRADVDQCASELAAILDAHPMPQPAPDVQARPGYVTVDARDIAIALNGYVGFTGDPALFAGELHERLRRAVFADAAQEPRPAPELAAAMAETRNLRARVMAEAVRLDASAKTSHPSKKSDIEADLAARLRKILGGQ